MLLGKEPVCGFLGLSEEMGSTVAFSRKSQPSGKHLDNDWATRPVARLQRAHQLNRALWTREGELEAFKAKGTRGDTCGQQDKEDRLSSVLRCNTRLSISLDDPKSIERKITQYALHESSGHDGLEIQKEEA